MSDSFKTSLVSGERFATNLGHNVVIQTCDTYVQVEEKEDGVVITATDAAGTTQGKVYHGKNYLVPCVEAAEAAADRAEAARDSILQSEEKTTQAAEDAEKNASNAALSEAAAKKSETLAQSYAEQATVPAVAGVYNVVLTDRVTTERYALIVEEGRIKLLGVADSVEATELTLIDVSTGISYAVVIDDGRLNLEEVE